MDIRGEINPHGYVLPQDAYVVFTLAYVKDNKETGKIENRVRLPHGICIVGYAITTEEDYAKS